MIPKNILVIRPDEIGDAVLNTVFLKGLKSLWPSASVTLVCRPKLLNFYHGCPWVDYLLPLELKPRGRISGLLHGLFFGLKLRGKNFDAVFLPRYGPDYYGAAWVALACGANRREGFRESIERWGFLSSKILTRKWPVKDNNRHEVENLRDALKDLGLKKPRLDLDLWICSDERQQAKIRFRQWNLKGKIAAIGIGASQEARRWPVEYFATVLNSIPAAGVLIGGMEDSVYYEKLLKLCDRKIVNACGSSLRQTIASLEKCDIFVGNDSGPMHLAAAAGLPVVEISKHPIRGSSTHANSPERFGPWGVPKIIIQPKETEPPCVDFCGENVPHCILQIKPEEVVAAAKRLLSKSKK